MLADARPLGHHYLVDFAGCDAATLDDPARLLAALRALCAAARLTELGQSVHRFEPQGVTALLLLAESHVALHTWPERGQAALDLFSCRSSAPEVLPFDELARALGAAHYAAQHVVRGVAQSAPPASK